jgi:hypothetical protein
VNTFLSWLRLWGALLLRRKPKPPPPPPPDPVPVPLPPARPDQWRGACWRLYKNPPQSAILAYLQGLQRAGANTVSLVVTHKCYLAPGTPNLAYPPAAWNEPRLIFPDVGQDPAHPFHDTPDPALMRYAVEQAAALGLRVVLTPHLDSDYGAWRGDIQIPDTLVVEFELAYRDIFLLPYIAIARDVPGTVLCLGKELYRVTQNPALGPAFWLRMLEYARAVGFTGPCTYGANWGFNPADAEYYLMRPAWPALDYIGISAYFPLSNVPDPAVDQLTEGWHIRPYTWAPSPFDAVTQLAEETETPVVFLEIGYGNYTGATAAPYQNPPADAVRNDALLLRCAQAARIVWWPVPAFKGWCWWEVADPTLAPALGPISDDLSARPDVQAVVFGGNP